jgi:hypothetical protein
MKNKTNKGEEERRLSKKTWREKGGKKELKKVEENLKAKNKHTDLKRCTEMNGKEEQAKITWKHHNQDDETTFFVFAISLVSYISILHIKATIRHLSCSTYQTPHTHIQQTKSKTTTTEEQKKTEWRQNLSSHPTNSSSSTATRNMEGNLLLPTSGPYRPWRSFSSSLVSSFAWPAEMGGGRKTRSVG